MVHGFLHVGCIDFLASRQFVQVARCRVCQYLALCLSQNNARRFLRLARWEAVSFLRILVPAVARQLGQLQNLFSRGADIGFA